MRRCDSCGVEYDHYEGETKNDPMLCHQCHKAAREFEAEGYTRTNPGRRIKPAYFPDTGRRTGISADAVDADYHGEPQ